MVGAGTADSSKRVLVVGGSGTFGRHLVHGLLASTNFDVVIGGRDRARSEATATRFREKYPAGRIDVAEADREHVEVETLRALRLFAIVDAAGPF